MSAEVLEPGLQTPRDGRAREAAGHCRAISRLSPFPCQEKRGRLESRSNDLRAQWTDSTKQTPSRVSLPQREGQKKWAEPITVLVWSAKKRLF